MGRSKKKVIPGHYELGDTLRMFGDSRLDETLGMDKEGRAEHTKNERLKAAKALKLPNNKGGGVETFLFRAARDGGTVVPEEE